MTYRPWLTTLAPIFNSFSRSVVNDQCSTSYGNANVSCGSRLARHKVHPNLITKWKRQAGEGLAGIFSGQQGGRDASHEAEITALHAKIGELTIEKDFLSKAFGR